MRKQPFFRPMFGGFAITLGALMIAPLSARADTLPVRGCDTAATAPVKKSHGLKLGRLFSAAGQSGMGQVLGAGLMRASPVGLVASVAGAALQASNKPKLDTAGTAVSACELARN